MQQVIVLLTKLRDLLIAPQEPVKAPPAPVTPTPAPLPPKPHKTPREQLYEAALAKIGKDLSNTAPNERGCAESLSRVIQEVETFKTYVSTIDLCRALRNHLDFVEIKETEALPGDICMMPTVGKSVGHCWVAGETRFMSNNSPTGTWEPNYTKAGVKAAATKRKLKLYWFRFT
jgi:hypothetical protein